MASVGVSLPLAVSLVTSIGVSLTTVMPVMAWSGESLLNVQVSLTFQQATSTTHGPAFLGFNVPYNSQYIPLVFGGFA